MTNTDRKAKNTDIHFLNDSVESKALIDFFNSEFRYKDRIYRNYSEVIHYFGNNQGALKEIIINKLFSNSKCVEIIKGSDLSAIGPYRVTSSNEITYDFAIRFILKFSKYLQYDRNGLFFLLKKIKGVFGLFRNQFNNETANSSNFERQFGKVMVRVLDYIFRFKINEDGKVDTAKTDYNFALIVFLYLVIFELLFFSVKVPGTNSFLTWILYHILNKISFAYLFVFINSWVLKFIDEIREIENS